MTTKHWEESTVFDYAYGGTFPDGRCCPNPPFADVCCPSSYRTSGTFSVKTKDFTRTGQSVAGWKSIIADGGNASSPMTVDKSEIFRDAVVNSTASYYHGPCCGVVSIYAKGTYGSSLPLSAPDNSSSFQPLVDRVLAAASRKFVKKVRELDHQFQGGVFVGQIGKTFKMLVNPFGALKRGIADHYFRLSNRRRGVRDKATLKRILAETWLETVFGWQPLLHDVSDAAKALARIYSDVPTNWETFKVFAEETGSLPVVYGGPVDLGPGLKFLTYTKKRFKFQCIYYGALKHLDKDQASTYLEQIVSLSGFDLRSWAPTAWELLPWSFLVDYFTNVGDIIDYYSTDFSNVKRSSKVERRVSITTNEMVADVASTKTYFGSSLRSLSMQGGSGTAFKTNIIRYSHSMPGYPGFRFELDPSLRQIANMGALVLGFKGQMKPFY